MSDQHEPPSGTPSSGSSSTASSQAQRSRWRQRATWLTQLGLADEEPAPVAALEEVAQAMLTLLKEVERLELEVAEARAWAWSDYHRELHYDWVSVAGNTYTGEAEQLPDWLTDPRTPPEQDWWPDPRPV